MKSSFPKVLVLMFAALAALSTALGDPPPRPWSDTADVSLIFTSGNSQNTNFAGSNKFLYKWTKSELTIDAAALRTESKDRVLTNPAGHADESRDSKVTAESYAAGGKYRYTITEGFFWYTGLGWMRNRPAGIDSRYAGGGGVGYRFLKTEGTSLVGEAGVDYTKEKQINGDRNSFAGAREFLGFDRALSPTSKFNAELEVLENFKESKDLRAKVMTSVTASLTKKLALKAGYTVLYDNQPVVVDVPGDTAGVATDTFVFDRVDSIFAASLVINF